MTRDLQHYHRLTMTDSYKLAHKNVNTKGLVWHRGGL
jgi:hypothetical protein